MPRRDPYSPDITAKICARLAKGESLRSICRDPDMPSRVTVHEWILANRDGFASQYARAKALGIDELVDSTLEIADDGSNDYTTDAEGRQVADHDHIARSRLRVDTRKWYASKLAPKIYGDRTAVEVSGPDGGPIEIDDGTRAAKIAAILAAGARRLSDGTDLV